MMLNETISDQMKNVVEGAVEEVRSTEVQVVVEEIAYQYPGLPSALSYGELISGNEPRAEDVLLKGCKVIFS